VEKRIIIIVILPW